MKKTLTRHWSYLLTGPVLAALLIIFWFVNQNYLTSDKGMVALFLENPIPTFGLIIFGAHIGAFLFGEFNIKLPMTFEPLLLSFAGGFVAGAGAAIAEMSVHSAVLFNISGVFTLPAFMITKGWMYGVFMVLGGFVASKLLVLTISKTARYRREISVPEVFQSRKNHRIIFFSLIAIFTIAVLIVLVIPQLTIFEKTGFILAMVLLIVFGFVVERGTVCMSSMLKEWFISRSAYVWRSVLFTIMCLALLYQAGLNLSLYEPIALENYISNPVCLMIGSFLLGFGFIFADGCFIGSLWKAGQGNVINVISLVALVIGIGVVQFGKTLFIKQVNTTPGFIPNYLSSIMSPVLFLVILWVIGIFLFFIFKQRRYRY